MTSVPVETPPPTTAEPVEAEPSLRSRAMRASAWVIASKPLGMAIQLARSLILTRLLFPEAFGLMALVGVIMQGLAMCSDVGIGPNIIQSKRGNDEAFLQTAWTLQIIRGAALWLICCALAWPISLFYEEPMLLSLLPVAGLSVLIAGFGTTAGATHQRDLKLGLITILGLAATILNLVVMILAAWWLRSVWALVIGSLSGNLISVLIGHRFLPGIRHRFAWDRDAVRELIQFGKWVFVSTLLTFFAMQMDKLILGKLIPISLLGVYGIAMVLANLPRDTVNGFAGGILFPVLSEKFRQDPHRRHAAINRARGILLRLGLLLALGAAAAAPAFYGYLYDPRYHEAGWIAQLLAVSAWVTILFGTTGYTLLALGDSKALAFANLGNTIVTAAAAIFGYFQFGLAGFIVGYACGTAAGELIQGRFIRKHGVGVLRQDLAYTALFLTCVCPLFLAQWLMQRSGLSSSPWMLTSIGMAIWCIVALRYGPNLKRELMGNRPMPGFGWLSRQRTADAP